MIEGAPVGQRQSGSISIDVAPWETHRKAEVNLKTSKIVAATELCDLGLSEP